MTIIAPSLLSCDFLNLESEIQALNKSSDLWIHLDVMDGHFVPNLTFGTPVIKKLSQISKHKLDAHLMVKNPEFYANEFKDHGIFNFTFHWETVTHHDRFIHYLKEKYPSVGIALNPSTAITSIPTYLFKHIDLVLIMSVNPGFSGQNFIEDCVEKVKYLNQVKQTINPNLHIQIDGGVNHNNAPLLINAGASNLVAGSYIFNGVDKNYNERIESLR